MGNEKPLARMVTRNRRAFFRTATGVGATLAAGGGACASGVRRNPISWVHGTGATIVDAHGLERDRVEGSARVVHGRSWSTIPLHFAVPSPVLDTGASLRVKAVWVRLKAERGASIHAMTLHDCERTLVRIENMDIRRDDWEDVRVALDQPCGMVRSLGLTLECAFADVARQIGISTVGCEFELEA